MRRSLFFLLLVGCQQTTKPTEYPAPQSGVVHIDECQLYYETFGQGDPIIVLHGGPGCLDHNYLLPGMLKLAETHQIVFYDQRGSGKSLTGAKPEKITVNQFVKDLETLRKQLGYKTFTLIGHSWGGLLALNYAITHPEHLSRLILMNSTPSTSKGFSAFMGEYGKRTLSIKDCMQSIQKSEGFKKYDPAAYESLYRYIFETYCYDKKDAAKLSLHLTQESLRSGEFTMGVFVKSYLGGHYDLTKRLKSITCPTLIVNGDVDVIPAWTAEKTAKAIPNAQLVMLKKCGHFPYVEQPEKLFSAIENFMHQRAHL